MVEVKFTTSGDKEKPNSKRSKQKYMVKVNQEIKFTEQGNVLKRSEKWENNLKSNKKKKGYLLIRTFSIKAPKPLNSRNTYF